MNQELMTLDFWQDTVILYFLSFSHSNRFLRATGESGRSFLQSNIDP